MRPEFWQDEDVASWPESQRLFYIGLWCVADDAGFFEYEPSRIAAQLFPYESRRKREGRVDGWLAGLVGAEKVVRLDCGEHGHIPSLPRHQYPGGRKATPVKDKHLAHPVRVRDFPENLSVSAFVGDEIRGVVRGAAATEVSPPPFDGKLPSFAAILGGKVS